MDIYLYVNSSEKNRMGKVLSNETIISGSLKDETSVVSPVIIFEYNNPANFNYAYIPDFNRYYFISNFTVIRTGLWSMSMRVDVLESFKDAIKTIPAIVSNSEVNGADEYLSGDVWKSKVKEKTDIINFSSGLSESGHFILITAGG